MVKYTVTVEPKGISQGFDYSHNLDQVFEDDAGQLFTSSFREELKTHFQEQGQYRITDQDMEVIVQEWSADISLGYRESRIVLDLMPLDYIDPHSFEDEFELSIPEPIFPNLEHFIRDINLTVLPNLPNLNFDQQN